MLIERWPRRRGVQRVEDEIDVRRAVLLDHGFENVEILAQNPDRTVRETDRAGAGASGRHNEDALRKNLDAHVVRRQRRCRSDVGDGDGMRWVPVAQARAVAAAARTPPRLSASPRAPSRSVVVSLGGGANLLMVATATSWPRGHSRMKCTMDSGPAPQSLQTSRYSPLPRGPEGNSRTKSCMQHAACMLRAEVVLSSVGWLGCGVLSSAGGVSVYCCARHSVISSLV